MPLFRRRAAHRTPGQQLLLMAIIGILGTALLMAALSWASGISTSDAGVDPKTRTITISISTEPPNLDSTQGADSVSAFVLGHVMEGLLRFDAHNHIAPGVAYKWKITKTGATFWLRHDARWSNGTPVTAHDFVFAWRREADPSNGSSGANNMYLLKNGRAVVAGKLPPRALGVQAVGNWKLQVQFAHPVSYFAPYMASSYFFPVPEKFYKATNGTYAADADKMLYNGPFMMTLWVHGAHIRMQKNPYYWNRNAIYLNTIDIPYFTSDPGAIINLFRDGKIAMAFLGEQNLKQAQLMRWKIKSAPTGGLFYMEFNFRKGHVTRNLNFRKALQYTLSASEVVNKVIKEPGNIPAYSLFPSTVDGVNGKFETEYPPRRIIPDPVKARHYLALAKKQLGLKKFPPITLLTFDSDASNRMAQYYQSKLKQVLGLDIRINQQAFKQKLAQSRAGDFDLNFVGWGSGIPDPALYARVVEAGNPNNDGHFDNPQVDAEITIARHSDDPATRMKAFAAVQKILIDQVAILPQFEQTGLYVVNPGVTGIIASPLQPNPNLTYVRFTGK